MKAPYDMGIKQFKRLLKKNNNLKRSDKNKAVRIYKDRITERLKEVVEQMKEIDKNE